MLLNCSSPGTGRGDRAHREPLVEVGNALGARQGRGTFNTPGKFRVESRLEASLHREKLVFRQLDILRS